MSNSNLVRKFDRIVIHHRDYQNQWYWVFVRFFAQKDIPSQLWKKPIRKAPEVYYRPGGKQACEEDIKMWQDEGELPKCEIVIIEQNWKI